MTMATASRPFRPATLPAPALPRPDPVRILGYSSAIAMNLVAAGLLLMPMQAPPPAPPPNAPTVWIIPATPPIPVPPPTVVPPRPATATPAPRSAPRLAPTPPTAAPVVVEQGTLPPPPVEVAGIEPAATVPAPAGPAPMQLQYAVATPPPYPRESVRNGDEGVVVLQVLVGVDGRPLDVTVVEGSGHRALDQAARRHVMDTWRFRPAVRDGHAVQALGLVPIEFSLD